MKALFFKFQRFFEGFSVCFGAAGFDTDIFQHTIVYQNEGHFILYLVIWLVVCGVNRFRT